MLPLKLCFALSIEILLQASADNSEGVWKRAIETGYDKEKFCLVNFMTGFYVSDLSNIIHGVNQWSCLLLCQRKRSCRSGNHHSDMNVCVLSSTNQDKHTSLSEISGWIYFEFTTCSQKARRPSLLPNDGEYHSGCGVPSFPNNDYVRVNKRIIGGQPVSPFAYPWMGRVAIDGVMVTECSLFLILENPNLEYTQWAMSSAHCFLSDLRLIRKWHFIFGAYDRRYPTTHEVRRTPKRVYFHDEYHWSRKDFILVKLNDKVFFNDYIKPICLPQIAEKPLPNNCWVSGWGRLTRSNPIAYQLEHLKVYLRPLGLFRGQPRDRDQLVILRHPGSYSSPYRGDSGGPLACQNAEGRFVAFGIIQSLRNVEFGYDAYTYLVKVADFVQWTKERMFNDSQRA